MAKTKVYYSEDMYFGCASKPRPDRYNWKKIDIIRFKQDIEDLLNRIKNISNINLPLEVDIKIDNLEELKQNGSKIVVYLQDLLEDLIIAGNLTQRQIDELTEFLQQSVLKDIFYIERDFDPVGFLKEISKDLVDNLQNKRIN